jgi:hypothetical protein
VSNEVFLEHVRKQTSEEESAAVFVSSSKNTKTAERATNLDECEKVLAHGVMCEYYNRGEFTCVKIK